MKNLAVMVASRKRSIEKQRMKVIAKCWEHAVSNGFTEKEAGAHVQKQIKPYNEMLGVA